MNITPRELLHGLVMAALAILIVVSLIWWTVGLANGVFATGPIHQPIGRHHDRRNPRQGRKQMNAEQIESIINAHLDVNVGRIDLPSFVVFPRGAFDNAIKLTAYDIAQAMAEEELPTVTIPEPPEPPKTILPDMSNAEMGKPYRFIGEDGTEVEYRHDSTDDHLPWIVLNEGEPDSHYWLSTEYFVIKFPHLGRLHRTGPKEVAE